MAEEDDPRDELVTHVVRIQQMLQTGLELFYTADRINRVQNGTTNISRFTLKFGIQPVTACTVYEDLQKTTIDASRISNPDATTLKHFLMSLYYLRKYPTEDEMESTLDFSI